MALALVALPAPGPAHASEVSWRIEAERTLERRIVQLSRSAQRRERRLHDHVVAAQRTADDRPGLNSLSILSAAHRAERRYRWRVSRRLRHLEARRAAIASWLATWAVFRVCPVDPPRYVHDDFGQVVRVGNVEPHVHRGSDIQAPTWTPIRAPFDGYAVSSSSPLGGYQVRVHGERGYAFIAHLIGYGRLGWVRAGTMVGYVGSTGLSTAPHAHFEWHPRDGAAVDPYFLLRLTCG